MGEPEAISGNDVEKKRMKRVKQCSQSDSEWKPKAAEEAKTKQKQTTRDKWWRKSIQSKGKTTPTEEEEEEEKSINNNGINNIINY